MSTATAGAPARTAPGQANGDVLVVFGITGDLAKVMTFRSLYRLEARGLLDCPIVGVAVDDWSIDDLKERARTSIEGTGGVVVDRESAALTAVCADSTGVIRMARTKAVTASASAAPNASSVVRMYGARGRRIVIVHLHASVE